MRVAGRAAASAVPVVAGACALAVGVSGPSAEAAGLTGGLRTRGGASLSTFQPAPGQLGRWETPLILLAVLLIVTGVGYGMAMLAASRRDPRGPRDGRKTLPAAGPGQLLPRAGGDLFFVFMMPCLNEEKVILNSLQRLLSIPGDDFGVLVIDDGSDDRTVDVLSGVLGERVWLLSRKPPQARQGKGEALNAAVRHLVGSGYLADRDPANVIVVVVDADGRLDPQSIEHVSPYFADPAIGAVQIGVRINNREQSRLARMQDMEFVIYTEVFQRGRRHRRTSRPCMPCTRRRGSASARSGWATR